MGQGDISYWELIRTLKKKVQKGHQFDNFVVIGGTILWCHVTVPPVTTTLSNWRSFVFSEYSNKGLLPSTVFWLAHCINITLLGCCRLTLWMLLLQEIDEFERGLSGVDHNSRHHPYSSSIVKRQEFDDQRGLFYKRSLHFGINNLKQYLRMNTYSSKW